MSRDQSVAQLFTGNMPERYQRNLGTIGIDGQLALLNSRVAIVGAGGLGGLVIELLARQGVGYLTVVDGDCFTCHNLNRQILATEHTLGMNKAMAAVSRVAEINPDVQVAAVPEMLTADNAAEILSGADVIVDALDLISSRRILFQTAQEMKVPLVHAAIAGFTGQVSTILPGDHEISALFARPSESDHGIESVLGNPAVTPAVAAALQVQETVKLITGVGKPLHRQLLYFDLEYNVFEIIQLSGKE
ncbi:MAG: ThiF family adenylyltransferase [Negativicutes bacterium]